jgi:hypothetical protein
MIDKKNRIKNYKVSFGSDRNEDYVVADADFLALGALLRRRMYSPPAGLAL